MGVGESNGVVTSGLGRQLAAEFTFSQNTRKPSEMDVLCQWTIYWKSDRRIEWGRNFRTKTPTSGKGNVKTANIKSKNFPVYSQL